MPPDAHPPSRAIVRVAFYDADPMGVVHHSNYLRYFENARVEWFRSRGIVYGSWLGPGLHLAVVESHVRYRTPARFDEFLAVEAVLDRVERVSLEFRYQAIAQNDGRLVAEGSTLHACVGDDFRLKRFPRHVRDALLREWEPAHA